jgi:PLP dependent protein
MDAAVSVNTIRNNLESVLERIAHAAGSVGREPDAVRLVVVTKGHSVQRIQAAVDAGACLLGENYVEEALDKMVSLSNRIGVEWHMIGHIQSRKASLVIENFSFVHSLDSIKLASRLNRYAGEAGRRLPVLLECNVSGEESKFGFPTWDDAQWQPFFEQAAQIAGLEHLSVRGLMTMAPFFDEAEPARPYFQRLARLRDSLAAKIPQANWGDLSMGMSGDFEVAVQEGATMLRIGQAILGPRPT